MSYCVSGLKEEIVSTKIKNDTSEFLQDLKLDNITTESAMLNTTKLAAVNTTQLISRIIDTNVLKTTKKTEVATTKSIDFKIKSILNKTNKHSIFEKVNITKSVLTNLTATIINATFNSNPEVSFTLASLIIAVLENDTSSTPQSMKNHSSESKLKSTYLTSIDAKKNNLKVLVNYIKERKTLKNIVTDIQQFYTYRQIAVIVKETLVDSIKNALTRFSQKANLKKGN